MSDSKNETAVAPELDKPPYYQIAFFTKAVDCRRAWAAVNACAGIPDEALEAGVVEKLVAALKEIEQHHMVLNDAVGRDYRESQTINIARAAIAKAQRGT